MAYDEQLADRIRALLDTEADRSEKRMFGGLAFLLGGNMALAASGQGGLMVRVPPEQTAELIEEPGAAPFEMRGKPMDGWIRVDADAVEDEEPLQRWVGIGVGRARSLPPK